MQEEKSVPCGGNLRANCAWVLPECLGCEEVPSPNMYDLHRWTSSSGRDRAGLPSAMRCRSKHPDRVSVLSAVLQDRRSR